MIYFVLFTFFIFILASTVLIFKKNMHLWIVSYSINSIRSRVKRKSPNLKHIIFSFVDHFEPMWENPTPSQQLYRVKRWCDDYPRIALKHFDADGQHPKHTFFYPEEEYTEHYLSLLSDLCSKNLGEIEIHLHHDNDTEDNLRKTLESFINILHTKHHALTYDITTKLPLFGFIHGNWCLDNSGRSGKGCGINNELIILKEMGCYADFTFPSAPSETQPSKINSIYYAVDDPLKSKSHNHGINVKVGRPPSGDLLMMSGPLCINWRSRKLGIIPHIENGDVRFGNLPTNDRINYWVKTGISVEGQPDWIFVKIHTHGAQEATLEAMLGGALDKMFDCLETKYNDGQNYSLHYVSSRETYNIVKAAEAGKIGNPDMYRDFLLPPPRLLNRNFNN